MIIDKVLYNYHVLKCVRMKISHEFVGGQWNSVSMVLIGQ